MQLFRFIDVFPMLRTPALVHDYLTDYLSQPGVTLPPGMDLGPEGRRAGQGNHGQDDLQPHHGHGRATSSPAWTPPPPCPTCKSSGAKASPSASICWARRASATEEVAAYQRRYLDLIETLPAAVAEWPANPRLETDYLGPIPRTNVSIKISSLCARTDPIDFEGSLRA